jgi:hypothetical protein
VALVVTRALFDSPSFLVSTAPEHFVVSPDAEPFLLPDVDPILLSLGDNFLLLTAIALAAAVVAAETASLLPLPIIPVLRFSLRLPAWVLLALLRPELSRMAVTILLPDESCGDWGVSMYFIGTNFGVTTSETCF